jgi:hypothetical protein
VNGPTVPIWGGDGNAGNDYAGRTGKGFARVTGDESGKINIPVWRATTIVSDNRIKAKATDQSSYQFNLLGVDWQEDAPIFITAKLIYRSDFRAGTSGSADDTGDFVMQEKTVELGGGL